MTETDMRVRVLLSVQRALLGHIGTAVRAIMCQWNEDKIHVRAIFDGEISDDDAEAISEAETEVFADFPSRTSVCFKLERCDRPLSIKHNADEVMVFKRLENPC
jgi:hypothetical protein